MSSDQTIHGYNLNMERGFNRPQNFTEMFGGVQPSKQALYFARKAISLGEDPTALTQQAGIAAQRDGRNKVGFFGRAEQPLSNLKAVVESIERSNTMAASSRKANRR